MRAFETFFKKLFDAVEKDEEKTYFFQSEKPRTAKNDKMRMKQTNAEQDRERKLLREKDQQTEDKYRKLWKH